VGFRAISHRARDQKLGVSARQLAGGESPVDGRCYKDLPFFAPTLAPLLPYRGCRREVYGGGSHHLERVTSSMASKTNPAAVG
jgi:hypothetical protein